MNINQPKFYFSFPRQDSISSTDAQIVEGSSPPTRDAKTGAEKNIADEFQRYENNSFKHKLKKLFCFR